MIGIDFGATYVDVVVIEEGKLKRTYSELEANYSKEFLKNILDIEVLWKKQKPGRGNISVTGIKSGKFDIFTVGKKNPHITEMKKHLNVSEISEVESIASGAKFLCGLDRFIALNVGTGTPIVFVDGIKTTHIAGTGIGGGTLEGLGKILLNEPVSNIESIARRGGPALDLKIGDLVSSVSKLPGSATASNFGKTKMVEKIRIEDVANSLLRLIGETLGVMGALAAMGKNCTDVVYTGRVVDENAFIKQTIKEACGLFGARAIFPENAKYATAIGAVMAANKN